MEERPLPSDGLLLAYVRTQSRDQVFSLLTKTVGNWWGSDHADLPSAHQWLSGEKRGLWSTGTGKTEAALAFLARLARRPASRADILRRCLASQQLRSSFLRTIRATALWGFWRAVLVPVDIDPRPELPTQNLLASSCRVTRGPTDLRMTLPPVIRGELFAHV